MGWSNIHNWTLKEIRNSLEKSVRLAHPDMKKVFCLFTDASERFSLGVLTQIPPDDLDQSSEKQRHARLVFLSGSLSGEKSRWSTSKEAAVILNSVQILDYLLIRPQGFHIFTDHGNFVFLFSPERTTAHFGKTVFHMLSRWATILASFNYEIVHISGESNCCADLLSRWAAPGCNDTEAVKSNKLFA